MARASRAVAAAAAALLLSAASASNATSSTNGGQNIGDIMHKGGGGWSTGAPAARGPLRRRGYGARRAHPVLHRLGIGQREHRLFSGLLSGAAPAHRRGEQANAASGRARRRSSDLQRGACGGIAPALLRTAHRKELKAPGGGAASCDGG